MRGSPLERINNRYEAQTAWSASLRAFLLARLARNSSLNILEVGSGTGAVLRALLRENPAVNLHLTGVDSDPASLRFSSARTDAYHCRGVGENLPFPSNVFDFVICHYLLLWVKDPVSVLREIYRVTVPGGICAVLAEPCYGEMKADPRDLWDLADQQRERLTLAGADVNIGGKLSDLFRQSAWPEPVLDRYQTLPMDENALAAEIRQMREDCDDSAFQLKKGVKYSYTVPTYFGYARKKPEVES